MRIALYNHTSEVSGAEINLLLTAAYMPQTSFVLYAPEGELLERARSQGMETVALPGYSARLSMNPIRLVKGAAGMALAGWRFASMVNKARPDVIHANSVRAGIMASMFRWYHRIPLAWHLHDMPPKGIIGGLIRLLAAGTTQALIAISQPVLEGMKTRALENRIHLVHNGAVLKEQDELARRYSKKELRGELQTPMESGVLVIVGQITPWKRQEDAIQALHALLLDNRDLYLWIVGEPKFRSENEVYFERLKLLVSILHMEDRVRFTGFREDIDEICNAADMLLLCSENEPFGRVIIEAMAKGTPVVATDGGGVSDIIEPGISGLLYPATDTKALAASIGSVLDDRKLRTTLSVNGRKRIEAFFSIEGAAEKLEHVYEDIARTGQRTGVNVKPVERARGIAK
ncbi:glycosyltransferase family 4 protein [Paenibacillus radicis (ex Gao et al. 2016)]|uniref:Glycosyl transferase n=1 Tax=Paenibacillus radicis (ex Gao et al. 2016) TaxID=1737354 RepID=A0A917HEY6_9BACL|nr:glycosyltransferase family 4 protein [Paenibacillus radicis (ex Gao et al. 2016)]GGG76481.1 putative glycosyl transferase [Paenibacillus radicis (ex Gao et al. 2016)]